MFLVVGVERSFGWGCSGFFPLVGVSVLPLLLVGGVVFWVVVGSWFLDQRVRTWAAAGVCVGLLASATVRTTMTCTTTACTGPMAGVVVTCTTAHSGASTGACADVTGTGACIGATTGAAAGAGAAAGVDVGLRATTAVVCATMACATTACGARTGAATCTGTAAGAVACTGVAGTGARAVTQTAACAGAVAVAGVGALAVGSSEFATWRKLRQLDAIVWCLTVSQRSDGCDTVTAVLNAATAAPSIIAWSRAGRQDAGAVAEVGSNGSRPAHRVFVSCHRCTSAVARGISRSEGIR